MKILIVFYSRTGKTRKIGQVLEETLKCDTEEIFDTKNRMGIFGWLYAGRDAFRKKLTTIQDAKYNPANYDLIIVGSPVWAGLPAPAIRAYLTQNVNNLKKIALFCTSGGSDVDKVFNELERVCTQKSIAQLHITSEEVDKNLFGVKIKHFIDTLQNLK